MCWVCRSYNFRDAYCLGFGLLGILFLNFLWRSVRKDLALYSCGRFHCLVKTEKKSLIFLDVLFCLCNHACMGAFASRGGFFYFWRSLLPSLLVPWIKDHNAGTFLASFRCQPWLFRFLSCLILEASTHQYWRLIALKLLLHVFNVVYWRHLLFTAVRFTGVERCFIFLPLFSRTRWHVSLWSKYWCVNLAKATANIKFLKSLLLWTQSLSLFLAT